MAGVKFRFIIGLITGAIGIGVGFAIGTAEGADSAVWAPVLGVGFYALGYLFAPMLAIVPSNRMQGWVWTLRKYIPLYRVVTAGIGLSFALVIAALLTLPLSQMPEPWGWIAPLICALILCWFFVPVMILHGRGVIKFFFSAYPQTGTTSDSRSNQIIVDTNAIIDGRIADVMHTGFIQGTLLVPRFVLEELRHIADSADLSRRNRGRRGLEMLNQLQRSPDIPLQISDIDFPDMQEVDSKLIRLAKMLRAPIVSNDMNLGKVATLEGVKVLSINELANAVKSVIIQGEDMIIRILQEGKEPGQGIGFLDDGTMVVVEGGRKYIENDVEITVTRVLQTAAGRMIFSQVKNLSQ